jgi:ABC-2 type transport system ATP-binding protein
MQNWAIEIQNLSKIFGRKKVALDDIDLAVPEGSVFGLMGPNGAGKSTLIKILMGIIFPSSGTAALLGRDISNPSGELRQDIAYVPEVQNFYPSFYVEDILGYCQRVYPNWDKKRCKTLLKAFDLPIEDRVRELSKGMKTRLAHIIALSIRPRLVILDEPGSGLDAVIKQEFMRLYMQEAASGAGIFFSTHNLHELERMADQVAVIMKGKLLFQRSLDEWKANSRKIQAIFPEGLPEEIKDLPGLLRVETQGKVYSIVLGDHFTENLERIKALKPQYMDTLDISLEDLFVYTMKKEGYSHEIALLE